MMLDDDGFSYEVLGMRPTNQEWKTTGYKGDVIETLGYSWCICHYYSRGVPQNHLIHGAVYLAIQHGAKCWID